jgi:tetraprenyl-beta-curcumene synthase
MALVLANLRYWSGVAPTVREQLSRWKAIARAIPDPALRAIAIRKLTDERFNVETAAAIATIAKPSHRRDSTRAIVALQVMYDYLDLLTEHPVASAPADSDCLYEALLDAVTLEPVTLEPDIAGDYYHGHPGSPDGGYLGELVKTVKTSLAQLPAGHSVEEVMLHGAKRCAQAQRLCHQGAGAVIAEPAQGWTQAASDTDLRWPETLAAASASVLCLHAQIAAAADVHTTRREAEALDAAYLSIGALTMLDSILDQDPDLATGELNYLRLYESPAAMSIRLALIARDAKRRAQTLPQGSHHVVTLLGIAAYYCSAIDKLGADTRGLTKPLRGELGPRFTLTLAIMRAWRLAKDIHARPRPRILGRSRPERFAG